MDILISDKIDFKSKLCYKIQRRILDADEKISSPRYKIYVCTYILQQSSKIYESKVSRIKGKCRWFNNNSWIFQYPTYDMYITTRQRSLRK